MDCKYVENKVWLYVEGDLKANKLQALARHIASCGGCARLVQDARDSQEWLRSCEPEHIDDALLDSVREGVRLKIADLERSRFQFVRVFAELNWKPLIIACPVIVLVLLVALHFSLLPKPNPQHQILVVESNRSMPGMVPVETHNQPEDVAAPHRARARHQRHAIKRNQAQPLRLKDERDLVAADQSYKAPLRIEIQTQDPNVRIIWFASPGDGSAPFGPDK